MISNSRSPELSNLKKSKHFESKIKNMYTNIFYDTQMENLLDMSEIKSNKNIQIFQWYQNPEIGQLFN